MASVPFRLALGFSCAAWAGCQAGTSVVGAGVVDAGVVGARVVDVGIVDARVVDVGIVDVGIVDARGIEVSSTPPSTLGPGFTEIPYELPAGVTFPPAGLESGDPLGLTGIVAGDIDGDGDPEVLMGSVSSFGIVRPMLAWTYRRAQGALTPIALPDVRGDGMPMALLDLDGDGFLDLINNRPAIAWGRPGGRFEPAVELLPRPKTNRAFQIMGMHVQDIDGDGWLDLLTGQRDCCPDCRAYRLLLRTGPRSFDDRTELIADNPFGGSYALLATPLGPEPMVLATFATCANSEQMFHRQASLDAAGLPRFEGFDLTRPDADYRQPRPDMCPNLSCRAPMGAWVGFLDGDEHLDLAVSLNPRHDVFLGGPAWPLRDLAPQASFTTTQAVETTRGMIPWGVAFIDFDQDGRPDTVSVHGNDFIPDSDRERFIGVQYPTLHWNAGALRFVDVTSLTGLQRMLGHWRSLWVGDLDGDADADLLVGGHRFAPRVLRNDIATGHRGLALALRGTTSNAYGLNAVVLVEARPGDAPQRFFMGGLSSPHSVSEPLIFVGLGDEERAARVEVRWPSGAVQVAENLAAGRVHTLREPALLRLEPATRRAPADGQSLVTFRFATPPSAAVALAITHGGGEVVAPPRRVGEEWVAQVRAPRTPGSTRFEFRIDGVTSGVHPRVWWE
jgi:hypothetical protein